MFPHPRVRAAVDAAVVLGALATIPLTVLQERGARSRALDALDWTVWAVFVIEFLFILSLAPRVQLRRLSTATDFAVVVLSFPLLPNLLALVRLARILRLLRLTRLMQWRCSGSRRSRRFSEGVAWSTSWRSRRC
jgi:hypothetical protein